MRCIRCEKNDSLVPEGYCMTCLASVHVEVEFGLLRFEEYLTRWAEFADWCAEHGRLAA